MDFRGSLRRWTAFNAVGAVGAAVQIATLALLVHGLDLPPVAATAIAVETAIFHNFAWHQRWTWRDRPVRSIRAAADRFARFQMLNGTISLVGNVGLVAAFSAVLHLTPIVANLAAIAICSLANFALSNSLIFTTALMGSSRPTRGKTCSTPIAELEAVTK